MHSSAAYSTSRTQKANRDVGGGQCGTVMRFVGVAAGGWLLVIAGCGDDGLGGAGDELPHDRTFLSTSVTEGDQPRSLAEGSRIRLDFAGDDLSVHAGCNYLGFRNARQDGEHLVVEQASFTEMGCGRELMDQDDWLIRFLTSEPIVHLDGDSLRLTSGDVTIELVDIEVATPDRPLVGTRWRINTIIDRESANTFNADAEAYLIFRDDGTVTARSACNVFSGRYEVDGSRLSVAALAGTDAGCQGYAAEIEAALLDVLDGDSTVDIETNKLTLTDANGKGVSFRTAP
jgi:heat shock protein HslJ